MTTAGCGTLRLFDAACRLRADFDRTEMKPAGRRASDAGGQGNSVCRIRPKEVCGGS